MYFSKAGVVALLAALPSTLACLGYEGGLPTPTSTKTNSKVIEVAAGATFDGGWAKYDRGSGACNEQAEGGDADAVFLLRRGATLKNVIIGKNQAEGVHCDGPCTLEFVWFEDVCEDAITVKNDKSGDHTWIIGGGAYKASDKIVQHNGCGTVNIINFYANTYGKLYRSCGNIVGINSNYGDTATLKNVCTDAKVRCQMYNGCAGGCEPTKSGVCSG
ncbi:putative pectate lyase F [Colletotrichum sp. SAR 10_70]|nr:putative pectate lyase F [Colletotrichum sp. SAR 10_71]KAI8187341.1 putative pectate lyase F [Colletotrichum sp. SAR 10_75]KAI8204768.1 putative pectate lyase F [Colletotrichum sp. SAR 10_70]KAI8211991.1 putative pectate lyase F [Colletotrichum sp. SAR 10_76]KAI8249389.1 putative pectate lyase F [Colletotrichum sp. SAR 10_77]KAJ4996798.1 putative pectate lyase F [Colletotrichum sp. SAR 10_66]